MEKERVCIGRKRSRRGGSGYTPRLKGPSDIRAVDTERSVAVVGVSACQSGSSGDDTETHSFVTVNSQLLVNMDGFFANMIKYLLFATNFLVFVSCINTTA